MLPIAWRQNITRLHCPELTLIDEHVQLGRTVYFQDNQLIGYFNREQSRGYLAAVYTIRNGVRVFGYSGHWYNQFKAGEYEQQNNGRYCG